MDFFDNFDGAITICDKNGIICYLNEKSVLTFQNYGGLDLIGKSLLDCHPEPAKTKLIEMLKNPHKNVYSIEKDGVKKMIYQSPIYNNDQFNGLIELSLEIPFDMPHFVRKTS